MDPFLIGGRSALELVQQYGSPIYVYDPAHIRSQYGLLRAAFTGMDVNIHYACKANGASEILEVFRELGAGVDTVSPNEIRRALRLGFSPSRIIFTPSCPGLDEIDFALDHGICIHFGSLEYLEMLGNRLNGTSIGIRLNPAVPIEGNQKIATAHARSKFGMPLNQLEKLKGLLEKYDIRLKTLHIHTGSDVSKREDLQRSFDVMLGLLDDFPSVDTLDIGSGLKIRYAETDKPFDLESYAGYIRQALASHTRPIRLLIEPGKFLVASSGYLLVRVNVVKQGYDRLFVGVNSGFHHLIRPMYYGAYHHIINLSNPNGELQSYDVVGQLCEEDTFARDIRLNEVRTGDILCILHAGAYAYAMSMTYNLRDKPTELLVDQGEIRLMSSEKIQA